MALSIKDPEVDALARELAEATGETITEAVHVALRERLDREKRGKRSLAEELMAIGRHFSSLPVLDDRTPEEIIGYDEHGVPR